MKILSKQNFNQNESKNFVVDNLSSAPSNPILGQVYYNTQNERAYVCIKSGETPEWADLSLQEEISIGGEEPNGRDVKIWINPEDMASSSDYGSLPIGSIIPYSGETAPEGYSICDGKELNRETYKELFSIIGTTFGNGDGTSTFNLPDLKGRVSVGLDSSDTNFNTIGKTGGEKTHTLTIDEIPAHTHNLTYNISGAGANTGGTVALGNTSTTSSFATLPTGGSKEHNNLQPYIVLNYIIKIYGEAMLTGDVIDSLEGDSSYNAPSIHAVNTKIKELEAYSSTAINEGSEITLDPNPNSNYNPIDIQIGGKSEQETTNGTNLIGLDNNQYKVDLKIGDKICVTNNGTTQLNLNLYTNYGDTARNDYFTIYANSKRIVSVLKDAKAIAWGGTIEGLVWVNKGEEQLPYEEYTGGQPSPSPDYPQEIKSVSGVENLLDESLLVDTSTTNGITFEKNDDNTFNLSGTVVGSTYNKTLLTLSEDLQPNENYYFYCSQPYNSATFNICVRVYFSDNTFQNIIPDRNTKIQNKKITATYVMFYAGVGTTVDTANNVRLMLSKKASDYVPYGHWLKVKNTGKNLFDKDNAKSGTFYNVSNGSIISSTVWSQSDYINSNGNITYTLSSSYIENNSSFEITQFDNNKNWLKSRQLSLTEPFSITTESTTKYIKVGFRNDRGVELNIQLEKGTEATSYEPYQEQSMLIDMNKYDDNDNIIGNYELCSIDNTKDELNIDKDGNVSITQNISEVVLNGSDDESWNTSGAGVDEGVKAYRTSFNISNLKTDTDIISNRFVNNRVNWFTDLSAGKMINTANNLYIRISETIAPDVETLKTWLSNNPVTVKYILAEPQTINLGKITPLKLLEGTNNITTNDELQPNMKIEYYTDIMGNPGIIPDYDGLPVGSEFDYDGTEIPDGFVQVDDPNTYSSEEVVIGTWFGKKLYRKTIYRGNSLSSFEHNIKNVESIFINNDHTCRVHTSGNCISLNASGAGSYVYVNKTTVTINNTSGASPDKVYVTLEYTKTTD